MQIQPLNPVEVRIAFDDLKTVCQLVELNNNTMILTGTEYLEKDMLIDFSSQFFNGQAQVEQVHYDKNQFEFRLTIKKIRYQPGLLVNTRL